MFERLNYWFRRTVMVGMIVFTFVVIVGVAYSMFATNPPGLIAVGSPVCALALLLFYAVQAAKNI